MSPVAFVIGAGSNVGSAVALRFLKEGYKVAVGSRKPDVESARKDGFVPVKVDVGDHTTITTAFAEVEKELGPANVVIYNGEPVISSNSVYAHVLIFLLVGNHYALPKDGDSLSLSIEQYNESTASGTNFFVIAKHAVDGFRKLSSGPKVVISTGNIAPWLPPMKDFFAVQLQKKVIAALVEDFVSRYDTEGFRLGLLYTTHYDRDLILRDILQVLYRVASYS
jgi:NAD(P)-dependent dehydrogenase (short-subunit alcohol dehydrogenase family)